MRVLEIKNINVLDGPPLSDEVFLAMIDEALKEESD
nr:MAG TPA: hypothetical protein [Caudoviricetes sp.]